MRTIKEYQKRFYNLLESTIGDVKPLITEQFEDECDESAEEQFWKNIKKISSNGFISKPVWDVNNYRIGYGSNSVTYDDGTFEYLPNTEEGINEKNKNGIFWKDFEITEEDEKRNTVRLLGGLKDRFGLPSFDELPETIKNVLYHLSFTFGRVPQTIIESVKSGDFCSVSNKVEQITISSQISPPIIPLLSNKIKKCFCSY